MSDSVEAIVTGSTDFGDAHRIIRLLTPDQGRTAVLARGARTGKKGWAGLLEPGARVGVLLKRGRGPLPLLAEVVAHAVPKRARTDLLRLSQLAYGVELCSALAPEHHEAPKLHRLLSAWLDVLEGDAAPGIATRHALEAKALTFSGFTPALVLCAVCHDRLDEPAVWSHADGGGAHGRCAQGTHVRPEELVRLEALRRTAMAETLGVRHAEPPWLLSDFAQWQLGRGLNSRAMLEEIEEG